MCEFVVQTNIDNSRNKTKNNYYIIKYHFIINRESTNTKNKNRDFKFDSTNYVLHAFTALFITFYIFIMINHFSFLFVCLDNIYLDIYYKHKSGNQSVSEVFVIVGENMRTKQKLSLQLFAHN